MTMTNAQFIVATRHLAEGIEELVTNYSEQENVQKLLIAIRDTAGRFSDPEGGPGRAFLEVEALATNILRDLMVR